MLLVAGSQGQENSAMTRIAGGEFKDIRLQPNDLVIFSADPLPGNELAVSSLVDAIATKVQPSCIQILPVVPSMSRAMALPAIICC